MASARALQAAGRFEASLAILEELVEEHPEDAEVSLLYGRALLRTRRAGLAVWPLRKAAEDPAHEIEAGLLLAQALRAGGDHPDALGALDRILTRHPEELRALEMRARVHLDARDEQAALADIERVLSVEPERLGSRVVRAMALIRLERLDEAEEALAEATALARSQEGPAEPILARLCAMRAVFSSERGEAEEARSRFEGCIEEHPSNSLVVSEFVEFLESEGDRERALEVLERAIEDAPQQVDLRVALATRLRKQGRNDEAEQLLLDVDAPPLARWTAVGDHYVALGDWEAAQSAFARALEGLRKPLPILLFGYADALIQGGDLARAREVAGDLEPPMSELLLGRIAFEEREFAAALQLLEAGLGRWPANPMAHFLAAQAAERLGDVDLALVHYRESVRSGPGHTRAALEMAALDDALGNFQEGLEPLRLYLAEHPAEPEAYALVARLAAGMGRPDLTDSALSRLADLPGQQPRAVREGVRLVLEYGNPAGAIELVEQSGVDLSNPRNAAALASYVDALVAADRAQDALSRVEALLAARPDDASLKALRARAMAADGRSAAEVRAALDEATDSEALVPEAWIALAELLAADGEVDQAVAIYDRVAAARPGEPDAAFAAARLLLAEGRTAAAERRLEELLVAHPRHGGAALELARRLAERPDELERARLLAARAVRFQRAPEAIDLLGRVLLARGENTAAIRAFENVLEQRPEAASTRYALARALSADGQVEAARSAYQQALASDAFPERERAEVELAELGSPPGERVETE